MEHGRQALHVHGAVRTIHSSPSYMWLQDISADGKVLLGDSQEGGLVGIHSLRAASDQMIDLPSESTIATGISQDGSRIAVDYSGAGSGPNYAVYLVKTDGSPPVRLGEGSSMGISPDGKWISYDSGESGRREVYVQRFPASGEKWQLSSAGGGQSRWRNDGKELFFLSTDGELMAVDVSRAPAFKSSTPHALFKARFSLGDRYQYAVSHDGQRFLAIVRESSTTPLTVLTNWTADLKH